MEETELPHGYTEEQVTRLQGYLRSNTIARVAKNKLSTASYRKLRDKLISEDPYNHSLMPLDKEGGVKYIKDLLDDKKYEGNQRKGIDIAWEKHLEGDTLGAVYAAITTKRKKTWHD